MVINALIYTTTRSQFFKEDFPLIREKLMQVAGVADVKFTVRSIKAPENPMTIKDSEGHVRFVWDWFRKMFVDPADEEYNVVALHITPYYRKKYGLSRKIRGSYDRNIGDRAMDFWFSCYKEESHYEGVGQAARLILHEVRHGISHWTGVKDTTHYHDYEAKDLLDSFGELSFVKWNLLFSLKPVVMALLELKKKLLWKP